MLPPIYSQGFPYFLIAEFTQMFFRKMTCQDWGWSGSYKRLSEVDLYYPCQILREETVMNRLERGRFENQRGITGIETAIILIAFVIVASVFAYVVLSAGLFSTQKAKEAIHAGLEEAKSTIEVKGNIYGRMESSVLQEVYFTVATTTGGDTIDFTPPSSSVNITNLVVISYSDAYQIYPTVNWTLTKLNTNGADNLLDKNELFMITVDLRMVSANATTPGQIPGPYHTFQLEVKPPVGAVLVLERTIPARVDQIVNLY
jgi:flagellin FlaB